MRQLTLVLLLIAFAAVYTAAQNAPRAFDNFDRSQGVQVYLPPPPPAPTKVVRKKRGSKWVVAVEDKLVQKTGQTSMVVKVSDGLAQRESVVYPSVSKLAMGTSSSLKGFTTGNPMHDSYIVDSARRYGIDPLLIYSQMHQESTFNIRATSNKGARGLMQLMPATARRM